MFLSPGRQLRLLGIVKGWHGPEGNCTGSPQSSPLHWEMVTPHGSDCPQAHPCTILAALKALSYSAHPVAPKHLCSSRQELPFTIQILLGGRPAPRQQTLVAVVLSICGFLHALVEEMKHDRR